MAASRLAEGSDLLHGRETGSPLPDPGRAAAPEGGRAAPKPGRSITVSFFVGDLKGLAGRERIEAALKQVRGVHAAEVDPTEQKATVSLNPGVVRLFDLMSALRRAGGQVRGGRT